MLPFIDVLCDILETVSSKNARLFSLRCFFGAVLIFSPFVTSCNTFKPVVKVDFPISFNDGMMEFTNYDLSCKRGERILSSYEWYVWD